jgi:hypothetical protein
VESPFDIDGVQEHDCAVVFLHPVNVEWAFHSEFNLEYDGISTYLFNSYWTNPADHSK